MFLILLMVLLLTSVRTFETSLFYDPFLSYFKSDYLNLKFPHFEGISLFLSMSLRYFLNTILSLAIIYIIFNDITLVKFISFLYVVFFVLLMVAFFSIILLFDKNSNFILFYIRRFLIQPLFLLLFIPALLYQKKQ